MSDRSFGAVLSRHTPDALVAVGSPSAPGLAEDKTAQDLLADAARVAARLPSLGAHQQVLLVFRQDSYAFAAALLAAWSRGLCVCLPPNQRGATVSDLLRPGHPQVQIGVLLHDTGAAGHLSVPELLTDQTPVPPLTRVTPTDPVAVKVLTSGSTGRSVAWDKSPAQLLSEVDILERTFALPHGVTYAVTVPPSHLYGLLFGVLLPLATGSSFTRNTPLLPGEVVATVQGHAARVLVSVPTHLRAVRAAAPESLASLQHVFSSAGPLPEETARSFTARHGKPITEIFGSTETGGIAFRQRETAAAWRPFAGVGVSVTSEQLLVVTSPFATGSTETTPGSFTTSDRVALLADGGFEHLGRQDGVVKIGGQRLSIPAMEECLAAHPEVEDVAVLALQDDVRGHRLLAAVCGPPHLEDSCKKLLAAAFEPSTLPRRFLFLDKLPREANGKLMRTRLLRLFGLNDDGSPLARKLEFQPVFEANRVRATVQIPDDYFAYAGHFDTYPVLAGAVQLQQLVLPLVRAARPQWLAPSELRRVKFMGRIEPGDEVDVALSLLENGCEFAITKADKTCSAGVLMFPREGASW